MVGEMRYGALLRYWGTEWDAQREVGANGR